MIRRRFLRCCLALTFVFPLTALVDQAWAVPQNGFILIFTVNPATGERVPNVPIIVRQTAGAVPFPGVETTTDAYGRLYLAVPPGTYLIYAEGYGGSPIEVYVRSRREVYVAIPIKPAT